MKLERFQLRGRKSSAVS